MNIIQKIACKLFRIQPDIVSDVRNVISDSPVGGSFFKDNITRTELEFAVSELMNVNGAISISIESDARAYRHVPLNVNEKSRLRTMTAIIKIKEIDWDEQCK